jgi:3-carboxy-cis,cis-muconate cycloisomerase
VSHEQHGADTGLFSPAWSGSEVAKRTSDAAFLQAMLDAEAALTRAWATVGHVPAEAGRAVTEAASAERFDIISLAERARSGGNPVIPLVADLMAAVPAQFREYVHRGATSQDIVDTGLMLVTRRALAVIVADLERTAAALGALAAAHRDTAMPGRTLGQHAVPTTFGLKSAGWRSLALDAQGRLNAVLSGLPAQLGGAAGTLAAFDAWASVDLAALELLSAYARELGLVEPALPWHTLRTPIGDLAGALAFAAGALGKLGVDVFTLSRTEIAEVAEGAGGGSSAMPHKSNPVRATLLTAAARQAPALASVLFGAMAAEDERPGGAWHAEWQPLRELLRVVGGAARDAAELAEGLRVDTDKMERDLFLTGGLIVSERLTAQLSARFGRAEAKALVAAASQRARETGASLAEALRAEGVTDAGDLTDPHRYTGEAPALVDRALHRT